MNLSLDDLPPLRDVIARHDLKAEKKFGQNFILDQNITDKIVRAAGNLEGRHVIEIGPGPGGLTRSILNAGPTKVTAIEFDPRAVTALKDLQNAAQGKLEIISGDALTIDLTILDPSPHIIIANLPYNVATPLLTGWLEKLRQNPNHFERMILMFQKEVAERLTAKPGGKDYGRLSILAQWICETERLFDLPPSVFTPPPKVTSSIVRFVPRTLPPDSPSLSDLEKLTAAAFGQRRKMLKSTLKVFPGLLEKSGIDGELRPEQVSVDAFIHLAKCLRA